MIEAIKKSKGRIVFICPGINKQIATAIIHSKSINPSIEITIILDEDPDVCRIGYGEIEGIEELINSGFPIRKNKGLRIGVLISDDEAFLFMPTPLVIEEVPHEGIINSIRLTQD